MDPLNVERQMLSNVWGWEPHYVPAKIEMMLTILLPFCRRYCRSAFSLKRGSKKTPRKQKEFTNEISWVFIFKLRIFSRKFLLREKTIALNFCGKNSNPLALKNALIARIEDWTDRIAFKTFSAVEKTTISYWTILESECKYALIFLKYILKRSELRIETCRIPLYKIYKRPYKIYRDPWDCRL